MYEYTMSRLASDRRRDLDREAKAARLAAEGKRQRPRTTIPTRPRGVRAQLGMILGRSAV